MAESSLTVRVPDLSVLRKFISSQDFKKVCTDLLKLQQARIGRGIGSNGRQMPQLSKAHAARVGRKTRTLNLTGRLLGARRVKVAESRAGWSANIGFVNARAYFYINQARTPFLAPTIGERRFLLKAVSKAVTARLKQNLKLVKKVTYKK